MHAHPPFGTPHNNTQRSFDETGAAPQQVCGNLLVTAASGNNATTAAAGGVPTEWARQVCAAKAAYEAALAAAESPAVRSAGGGESRPEAVAAAAAAEAVGAEPSVAAAAAEEELSKLEAAGAVALKKLPAGSTVRGDREDPNSAPGAVGAPVGRAAAIADVPARRAAAAAAAASAASDAGAAQTAAAVEVDATAASANTTAADAGAAATTNSRRRRRRALLQATGADALIGRFEQIPNPQLGGRSSTGSLAIHAALVPTTTKLLVWGRQQPTYEPGMTTDGTPEVASLYDWRAGTYVKAPMRLAPFCSGHSHLSDGAIVAGGGDWANAFLQEGRYAVRTWAKDGGAWRVEAASLAYPHWCMSDVMCV